MENKTDLVLTSVKIDNKLWDEFRIECVRQKFSLMKLVNRSVHLYLTDETYRKRLHSHVNIDSKKED